jgi:hypothetical protein
MKKRKKIKSWQKGRLKILAVVGAISMLIGMIMLPRIMLTKNLRNEVDAIRAAGHPTTALELDAWRKHVPDELNAAPLYLDAFKTFNAMYIVTPPAQFTNVAEFGGGHIGPDMEFDGAAHALVAEFLKLHAQTLSKLHEAATYSECQFSIENRERIGIRIPELEQIQRLAKLLCLEAALGVHDENLDQAENSFLVAMKLIRSVQGECNSWYFSVRADALQVVLRSLAWALSQRQFDDTALQHFASAFADQEDPAFIQSALFGDRVEIIELLNLESERAEGINAVIGVYDQWMLPILQGFTKMIDASQLPRAESLVAEERIYEEMCRHTLYSTIGHIVWKPSFLPFASLEARARLGQSIIAVERYLRQHNRLPESLDQLVPEFLHEVPIDPFDGKPIRYGPQNTGYKLYSVGRNRTDEKGDDTRDITFQVRAGSIKQ